MRNKSKPSILIAEDEDRWQEIYEESLASEYLLTHVKTFQGAESALAKTEFDVAIIDPCLDEKDSFNLDGIKIIKKINILDPSIQVIVVTGNKDRVQAGDPQINGFIDTVIEKGESIADLAIAVRKAIKVKTAKKRWNLLGRPAARITSYEAFKNILSQLLHLAKADVVHMLVPISQDALEIIVDTGQDEGRIVKINKSITGRSYRTKELIKLNECQSDPEYQSPQNTPKMNSELAVPVWQGDEIIGVLNIESQTKNAFDDWHQDLMKTFTNLAVLVLQEERRQTDLRQLNLIADKMLQPTSNLDRTLNDILGLALTLLDAQMAFLGRDEMRGLFIEASTVKDHHGMIWNIEKTISTDAIKSDLPKRIPHEGMIKSSHLDAGNLSEMVIPFSVDGITWLLGFGRDKPNMFTAEHEILVSLLSNQISFAISRENQSRRMIELEGQQKQSALAGRLLHKAGNPIFIIRDWLKEIKENDFANLQGEYPEIASIITRIRQNIVYAVEELNQLYDLYMSLGSTEVNKCVESAVMFMHPKAQENDILLGTQLETSLTLVQADENLGNVIRELVMNSIEATSQGGSIMVRVENQDGQIKISVTDTGSGISPDVRQYIFEPNFTTKISPTKFDGLGLSWCKKYVEEICKGKLYIEKTDVGIGTTMSILLPKAEKTE